MRTAEVVRKQDELSYLKKSMYNMFTAISKQWEQYCKGIKGENPIQSFLAESSQFYFILFKLQNRHAL